MRGTRTEDRLRDDVLAELEWDADVDTREIDVEVEGSTVTLVGTVGSHVHKLAAQEAARSVAGVHDIVNRIDVRPPTETRPTDAELERMIRQVLRWDALVPDRDISATVHDGIVTLAGTVSVPAQSRQAVRAVGGLVGVRDVVDEVVARPPVVAPDRVRASIMEALRRRAVHRADHIDITVDGQDVTVSGRAQSRREKVAILGAVAHAPGIAIVHDRLQIDPGS
jgi:osmotically-inducible protein OsmY